MATGRGLHPANCSRGPSAGDPGVPTRPCTSGHLADRRSKDDPDNLSRAKGNICLQLARGSQERSPPRIRSVTMTTQSRHDVVIVGARCAGATLATFLARAGASVLLLDKDPLQTDQILSTHTIHPPGLDVLDEVGVGDAVRAVAPPSHIVRLRKNDAFVDCEFSGGRAEYCPRRKRLDGLLQDAAASAGVEVLDRTRVTSLVRDGDRVVGVQAEGSGGPGTRIPGEPRCGSRRPSFHGRAPGRGGGVPWI